MDENSDFAKKIEKGIFTLREMQQQFSMIMEMGPISKVMSMLPGLSSDMFKGNDQEVTRRMRRCMAIMDSMTEGELDSDGKCILAQKTRIQRISLGSGTFAEEVEELLAQYKKFAQLVKRMGGKNGLLEGLASAGAGSSAASGASSDRNMSKMQQQLHQALVFRLGQENAHSPWHQ